MVMLGQSPSPLCVRHNKYIYISPHRDRQDEEVEKAGRQIKEEESEDADMSNPFLPINHIVAEVSFLFKQ